MFEQLKKYFGAQDLTVGSPMSNLLKFSIPLLIGNIAQQLYSTVDAIIVGRYVGDTALASVGSVMPIVNLLLVLFVAISTGAGILVSQAFGAKNKELLNQTIGNALTLIVVSSLLIMGFALAFSTHILRLLETPVEVFDAANAYLRILFIGAVWFGFYNIISGILRGLGDSITPLVFLLLTVAINMVLDIWFVAGLGWGVEGAAWATIISQFAASVMSLIHLVRIKDTVIINRKTLMPQRALTGQLTRIGMPAGMTQAIFSMAMIFVQALTNSMGYEVITTSTAVMRIDGFAMMPNFTFGMAISTYVAQNIGARRMDRVDQGSRAALKIGLIVSVSLTLLLIFFGSFMIRLFTDTPFIIQLGVRQIRILAAGYIAMTFTQIFGGIMRGAGHTMPMMWISLATTVTFRVPAAYLIAYLTRSDIWPNGSPDALYFSLVANWILGAILTFLIYRRGRWRDKDLSLLMKAQVAEH